MADCIFCKIANKEIDSEIVYETDDIVAFKDAHPQAPVHILVIPKKHYESLLDFGENEKALTAELLYTVKHLAQEYELDQSGFRVVNNCGQEGGQTVNHIHFHLMGKRQFTWPPG